MQKITRLSKMPILRAIILVGMSISISACGFHLRGNIPLSEGIQSMYLDAPDGNFKDTLEEVLTNAGAQLATGKGGADVVLRIKKAGTTRTVGTLDERGKANSYNLRFKVDYKLTEVGAAKDAEEIRKASLIEMRRYNFDPDLVLESESEEEELQSNMEESIALRIVRQLSTITSFSPKN